MNASSDAGAGGNCGAPAPTRGGEFGALGNPGAGGKGGKAPGCCCCWLLVSSCCCWRAFTSLSPSDGDASFPHATPSLSARPHRARANSRKNSNPRSPMTSRTARTTPSSQKHLASSAVPSAAQHRSRVPCASVLHAPAMPAKTNTRQSTAPAPEWSWRGSKCAACARGSTPVGLRAAPCDGAARAIAAARSGTIIARDGRMDVGATGTSRAGR